MKMHENFLSRSFAIRGKAVGFNIDTVRLPNGKEAKREYLDHPGAVAVLPFVSKSTVLLVQQYRYPVGKLTWEIPAGKLDPEEAPMACVKRELEEETGCRAKTWSKLVSFWPTAAFANEIIHIYTANNLVQGRPSPDADEFIRTTPWSLEAVYKAIKRGEIKDSKTIIAFLAYKAFGI